MCGRVSLARIEAFCISFYHEIAIKKINYRFHTFVLLISPKLKFGVHVVGDHNNHNLNQEIPT